ncbi:unnamed protein product [Caenorhabditis angaria]|uniref:Uncharacterized protein n=1 Tax=Caenorhabditis angaria TaxID=860376 RepID=A0A9P1I9M4_9PELO|nr:unnamed protein product [Caenorhabditis angaria]
MLVFRKREKFIGDLEAIKLMEDEEKSRVWEKLRLKFEKRLRNYKKELRKSSKKTNYLLRSPREVRLSDEQDEKLQQSKFAVNLKKLISYQKVLTIYDALPEQFFELLQNYRRNPIVAKSLYLFDGTYETHIRRQMEMIRENPEGDFDAFDFDESMEQFTVVTDAWKNKQLMLSEYRTCT